ncbi:MAG: hypothetical protein VB108_09055 [Anaerolineaceae bacterium]|nr:hypothetical protein [Anaerolineaceae bacterium]
MKSLKANSPLVSLLRSVLICSMLLGLLNISLVRSTPLPSKAPERFTTISVNTTIYEWWLMAWKDSQVVCQVYTEHETWPILEEVRYFCNTAVAGQWAATKPCVYDEKVNSPEQCSGLYLHLQNVTPAIKEVKVKLPAAEIFVSVAGCKNPPGENKCTELPYLRLEGIEPLPNEEIIQMGGMLNGLPFNCPGAVCDIPLSPTGMAGAKISFWGDSSFGDSTQTYEAQVRVIPWGDFGNPEQSSPDKPAYYVDVLSSQWKGSQSSTCAQVWQAFEPVSGPPPWLRTPELEADLVSSNDYFLLAGSLIRQGLVSAGACPAGGLEVNGSATVCGVEAAKDVINAWQNQFDAEIIRVGKERGVPAQMMKNVFSRESQFWPGIYQKAYEAGLGQLTDIGADAVLLWNPDFFTQFCPLVFSNETCQRGFGNLDKAQQQTLRGALVQKVNAACPDCPVGVDLSQANFSISIFARSLLANCEQVQQIYKNTTGRKAGELTSYEDLWKFTLLNYNAGSGCLAAAMQKTAANSQPLIWENMVRFLDPVCQAGEIYVNDIAGIPALRPTSVADLLATPKPLEVIATPVPTATPFFTPTPLPSLTPTGTLTITSTSVTPSP